MIDCPAEVMQSLVYGRIGEKPSIFELSKYEGINLWWFVNKDFQEFLFRVRDDPKLSINSNESKIFHRFAIYIFLVYSLMIMTFFKILKFILRRKNDLIRKEKQRILYTSQTGAWKTVTLNSGVKKKDDFLFFSLNEAVRKAGFQQTWTYYSDLMLIFHLRKLVHHFRVSVEKMKAKDFNYIPFENHMSFNVLKQTYYANRKFRSIWSQIDQMELSCLEINPHEERLLKSKLKGYFLCTFPFTVGYIEASDRLLEKENIDLVILINELFPWEISLIKAARERNIPTIAIQHGIILDRLQPSALLHSSIQKSRIIADRTLVYASVYKDILVKSRSYPEKQVIVTGAPRYDVLAFAQKIYDQKRTLSAVGLSPRRKTAILISHTHYLPRKENLRIVRLILSLIHYLKEMQLIIKLHQHEDQSASIYMQNLINSDSSKKSRIYIARGFEDTLELVNASDVVISKCSTVILEAVALHKPVILLEDPKKSTSEECKHQISNLVVTSVSDEHELVTEVQRAFIEKNRDKLELSKYIERHLLSIDGRATERAIMEIVRLFQDK